MKGPKNCFNCRSENIIGPYKYVDSGVYIAIFNIIRQEAYVCIDCGHTMLFTRKEHEGKVIKEAVRQQIISQ